MKKQFITVTVMCLIALGLFAQTQTVKGTIIDKQSEVPLIGAAVEVVDNANSIGTTTDFDGYFRLENVPIGRQTIRISYLGYHTITIPNVVVTTGKEVVLNVGLEESIEQLDEIVVTAEVEKDKAQNEMATISARTFSVEEVNRFSGGRSDVARLAGNFAGVSTADDSRNDIVIRGNSPTGVLWRLEGIPIPNPNHFSTLGTTGGPVSALNPNLLRNSDFITSAFPSEYGNALAGVFDLGFRSGNKDKHEFMVQMGAISGIEAMAEGPLNSKKNSSYLVAGRYSFVGLANEIGLLIGTNATPNYQDIAFKFDFANAPIGKFTVFGIGGRSDIDFLASEVDEDDLFAEDDQDAFVLSNFGVFGVKHNLLLNENSYWRTVASVSTSANDYKQDNYFNQGTSEAFRLRSVENRNIETRLSLSSYINTKFNARLTTRFGVLLENFNYDLAFNDRDGRPDVDSDGIPDWVRVYEFNEGTNLLQAFGQAQYKITSKLTLNAGLHSQYLSLNETFALEPRAALNWSFLPNQMLSLGYGLHHQTQPLPIMLLREQTAPGVFEETNRDLDFTRSKHYVLGYDIRLGSNWRAKAEVYYQDISDVPVEPNPSSFSILNVGADFVFPDDAFGLQNTGTGYNTGIELTIEKFFSKGYYGLLTASVFDSKYTASDGIERNAAFNNSYVLNILAGKEFKFGKDKRNAFTIDTKITTAGGRYYTPVDLEASRLAGTEVLKEDEAFSLQQDPYFRWDLKFGFQFNSAKRRLSHQFYFDIQNITNNDNIFALRYNENTNEINQVNQIGFFPDFMYRIQF